MRHFRIEDNQADMLRSELESGADDSEEEFQQTLDKYYHDADEFEQKLTDKATEAKSLEYFNTQSSSYYQDAENGIDDEITKMELRISETLSDYQKYCSDLRFSDGFGGKAKFS